jgi:hypothetical protein
MEYQDVNYPLNVSIFLHGGIYRRMQYTLNYGIGYMIYGLKLKTEKNAARCALKMLMINFFVAMLQY